MREVRSKIILASLAIAESCWLFAAFDIFGALVDFGGSPMPWIGVLGLLGLGMYSGWLFGGSNIDRSTAALVQGGLGLVLIYVFMSLGLYSGATFNLGWPSRVLAGEREGALVAAAMITFLFFMWLWRHAVLIGADRYSVDRLARTFKVGIAVLAIAVLVEQLSDGGANSTALLIPFFASALVGLAVGRLPDEGSRGNGSRWAQVIAVSVLIVIGAGLLLGLLGGIYGSGGVRLLYEGWELLVDGLLWILRIPIAILATVLLAFFRWVFSRRGEVEGEEIEPPEQGSGFEEQAQGVANAGDSTVETIVNIVQYPALVLVLIAAFLVLALAFRRLAARRERNDSGDRESLLGDARRGDLTRLLLGLLPDWMRGGHGRRSFVYPVEPPGLAGAFRLYFDTLAVAARNGAPLDELQTPTERVGSLSDALPYAPVRRITAVFNAACYGDVPADEAELNGLRSKMESPPRPGDG